MGNIYVMYAFCYSVFFSFVQSCMYPNFVVQYVQFIVQWMLCLIAYFPLLGITIKDRRCHQVYICLLATGIFIIRFPLEFSCKQTTAMFAFSFTHSVFLINMRNAFPSSKHICKDIYSIFINMHCKLLLADFAYFYDFVMCYHLYYWQLVFISISSIFWKLSKDWLLDWLDMSLLVTCWCLVAYLKPSQHQRKVH